MISSTGPYEIRVRIFIKFNCDGHVLDNPVIGSGHVLLFEVKH